MGCFSSLCLECHKGIEADTECVIILLHDGKMVEVMTGVYDNYGRVYHKEGSHVLIEPSLLEEDELQEIIQKEIQSEGGPAFNDSFHWLYDTWNHLVNRMFDHIIGSDGYTRTPSGLISGFAYYHKDCYHSQVPTRASESDPNQGWGESEEQHLFTKKDQFTALQQLQQSHINAAYNWGRITPELVNQQYLRIFRAFEQILKKTYYHVES